MEVIHDLRENSRTSSAPPSFTVLETYCQQLREVEAMLLSVINEVSQIQSQIQSSISIQRTLSTSSDDPLIQQLTTIDNFLTHLKQLYEADMSIKKTVIGELILVFNKIFIIKCLYLLIYRKYCPFKFR